MSKSTAEKFVDRVYRRLVIYRIIEQLGFCLLLAAGLATALNLLAIWQSMPTFPILINCVSLGLLAGTASAVYRWPTRYWAAAEADRQLGFDDLLTSAIFSYAPISDDFLKTVRAMADARCAQSSPGTVALWRLSARAWSGIVLTMVIAVILGVIPFNPVQSQAVDANLTVLSENTGAAAGKSQGNIYRQTNDPTSESRWGAGLSTVQQIDPAATGVDQSSSQSAQNAATYSSGAGESALTDERSSVWKLTGNGAFGTRNTGENGYAAGGGTSSGDDANGGDTTIGQKGIATRSNARAPIWAGDKSAGGISDSKALSNDQIPPRDRDLVRDFFNAQ